MTAALLVTLLVLVPPLSQGLYLLYCPCMGRFGNQADQFLGSLAFSKSLNRTLVLPPWISYSPGGGGVSLLPWDSLFDLELVSSFHSVITMETFMKTIAPTEWPEEERTSFCYSARPGEAQDSCNAKHGSPFGPFWSSFSVEFARSEMFGPLGFSTSPTNMRRWREKYERWPVLAMTGAPAPFPVAEDNVELQKYIRWKPEWIRKAQSWVTENMGPGAKYIGLHLRNGLDWVRACDHVTRPGVSALFSSPQCLGYRGERGELGEQLCRPGADTVISQLGEAIRDTGLSHVFVASDSDHMLREFRASFSGAGVRVTRLAEDDFRLDLVILERGELFIGNCVSSFSAFVKRSRDVAGRPSAFWGFSEKIEEGKSEL